jgi:hypothetical protein
MIVVSNASPLIMLSRVGLLHVAKELFREINISHAVYNEVVSQGKGKPGSRELANARDTWIQIHPTPKNLKPYTDRRKLSKADASVIVLAQKLKADLILIDELALRETAHAEHFTITGYAGILFRAKQKGLIANVHEPLEQGVAQGLRLSEALQESVLRDADEFEEK